MRLFIAIKLSDEMRNTLAKTQEYLLRHGVRGRYLPRENLHMTLAFIGELPDPAPVLDVLDAISFPAFSITLDKPCIFRNSILCAGVQPSEPLERLADCLRRELAGAGIPYDRQTFRPHITLIREMDMGKGLPEVRIPDTSMAVDHITLYRSDRGKNGMIYTEI